MSKLYWHFSPQWVGWFLVRDDGLAQKQGYGPFMSDFEIQAAADIHGVPFDAAAALAGEAKPTLPERER